MDGPAPIIICGPSGVGKSVLIKKLQEVFPNKFGFSVSHTTRDPRPGEQDGKDYHFSDLATVEREVAEGKFIEHARVHGNMYGTSKAAVEAVRSEGKVCILDIDVQGAKSIHEQNIWPETKFIFVNPPSLEELERRLRGRGTETEEKILKRLGNAKGEIDFSNQVSFFNHKFVLDGLTGCYVPKPVLNLFRMLNTWYPSLGKLPPHMEVLGCFVDGDSSSAGLMAQSQLVGVLKNLEQFSDNEVQQLLAPALTKDGSVDYQKFLSFLFTGAC